MDASVKLSIEHARNDHVNQLGTADREIKRLEGALATAQQQKARAIKSLREHNLALERSVDDYAYDETVYSRLRGREFTQSADETVMPSAKG